MLCATSAITVLPVRTIAVSTSRPDVRRPVTARHAIAPYDQHSATMIAGHTPNSWYMVKNRAAGIAQATVRLRPTRRSTVRSRGRVVTGASTQVSWRQVSSGQARTVAARETWDPI